MIKLSLSLIELAVTKILPKIRLHWDMRRTLALSITGIGKANAESVADDLIEVVLSLKKEVTELTRKNEEHDRNSIYITGKAYLNTKVEKR